MLQNLITSKSEVALLLSSVSTSLDDDSRFSSPSFCEALSFSDVFSAVNSSTVLLSLPISASAAAVSSNIQK